MTASRKGPTGLVTTLLTVLGIVVGVIAAQFLPADLFGLRAHSGETAPTIEASEEETGLWTCGMHPQVIQDGPGQCPICGMDLTPLASTGDAHAGHDHGSGHGAMTEMSGTEPTTWTCPDHAMIEESEAGTCPIDGLDLVPKQPEASMEQGERTVLFYRNPMDPTITSPVPAKDSMGMDYTPVYSDEVDAGGSGTTIRIDPQVVQNMNVRSERVTRQDLTQPIRTVGYLEYDQQRMVTVTTKYSGWVEKVSVNYVGERVRRGQALFEIYSPELVQTEQELLSALDFAREMGDAPEDARRRAESLVESARTRLSYWDISPEQIARLEETGEVFRTLAVSAPADGLVMKRMPGLEGMAVKPGMELFHIADLSSIWLSVELFEDQLAWVHEGTRADVSLSYFPGETFQGEVRFLEPELSEATRTLRATIEIPNRSGRLRKGMYATVDLEPVVTTGALVVPTQAILRTGERNVVVVALGEGRFAPREVVLGHESEGLAQVISGVEEGTQVVTSAQFLLDSESTLQEAIQKMIAARRAGGTDTASDDAPADSSTASMTDHSGH